MQFGDVDRGEEDIILENRRIANAHPRFQIAVERLLGDEGGPRGHEMAGRLAAVDGCPVAECYPANQHSRQEKNRGF